ncbi:MAG: hypothetical protein M0Z64_11360 [Nitrospiraceae bacterium]|nr:hypothetical protein [Nitrospiraceae bacterium]
MQLISESIDLKVSDESAFPVLSNLDVILRLSPYWSLKEFKSLSESPVRKGSRYEATLEYYGKEVTETHGLEITEILENKKISLRVENGVLKELTFLIEKNNEGIRLTHQFLIDSDDEALLKGTQTELRFWLRSIGEYLKIAGGKTLWRRFFKWFMDRVWLRLTLSERKIAIIITKISVLELVLLLMLVIIWNMFVKSR